MKYLQRITTVTLTIVLCSLGMAAQREFSLEDLNFGGTNYKNMIPQNRSLAWWGDELIRLSADTCFSVNAASGKEKVLFTRQQINKWAALDEDSIAVGKLTGARFPYPDRPLVLLETKKERLLINFKKRCTEWHQERCATAAADAWSEQSRATAWIEDDNLFACDATGKTFRVTDDGSRDIVYGQSVHRNEFGINGGLFFSPDGTKLAFYRMDQSMVDDYPLVTIPETSDSTHRIATPAPEKYPMAGMTSHVVTVGVLDINTGDTVYLKAGDPTDRYFSNIAWHPAGHIVYMMEHNRDQNDCALMAYDATTGKRLAQLYRETHPKYVEPRHPITFLPWDSTRFVLQSERDGYNHLYLLDTQGKQLSQLTRGQWVVTGFLGFDAEAHTAIITANAISPLQQNIFAVNVDNGSLTCIDEGQRGWHNGTLSKSGRLLIDNYQEPDVPRNIAIINTATGTGHRYFTAPNPWQGYTVPEYRCGTITAADDSTTLYYRLVLPTGFDPAKKYPTVVYVYGGPHAHNVDARWHYASRSWETYMAQRGYVLFILDNRGSENRGREFEQVTFRRLGQEEMRDQMRGVDFLKTLSYVDTTRLGVHGWSFGGFMTISLMTHYPDVFKVGVAGGPVIDWKWYEVMYGERYMDTPQDNPEGYAATSLIHQAKNLKGRLQIIIGLNDPVVVPQHAYSFLKACIEAGTQPDFYVYPGQGHNMQGHQSVHLHERITRYFDDHLK